VPGYKSGRESRYGFPRYIFTNNSEDIIRISGSLPSGRHRLPHVEAQHDLDRPARSRREARSFIGAKP
jgi:hypothetical protein